MTADPAAPEKIGALTELLSRSLIVNVALDAHVDGCVLPEHLRADPCLIIAIGYNLQPPIHDLELGPESLTGTLSFRGAPFHCTIPWRAVYAIRAGERWAYWPGSVPVDVPTEPAPAPTLSPAEEKARRRAHLSLVP